MLFGEPTRTDTRVLNCGVNCSLSQPQASIPRRRLAFCFWFRLTVCHLQAARNRCHGVKKTCLTSRDISSKQTLRRFLELHLTAIFLRPAPHSSLAVQGNSIDLNPQLRGLLRQILLRVGVARGACIEASQITRGDCCCCCCIISCIGVCVFASAVAATAAEAAVEMAAVVGLLSKSAIAVAVFLS